MIAIKRAALTQIKFKKNPHQAFLRQKTIPPDKPRKIEREGNQAVQYTKKFSHLISGDINIGKLLHANIDFLKTCTKSSYGYVYVVRKDQLYFSTPTTDETENVHWLIEENSSRIAAAVAYKKEFVVIADVQKQKHFLLGCHITDIHNIPKSLLCVPLVTPSDVCFGVIELQRQDVEEPYEMSDIKTVVAITGWIGATVHQKWERKYPEKDLQLVDTLAEFLNQCLRDDCDVDRLITDITNLIKEHLCAEKCIFYKTNHKDDESVVHAFEESLDTEKCRFVDHMYMKNAPERSTEDHGLVSLALKSKEIINIEHIYDPRFNPRIDGKKGGINVRNLMVVPIWSSKRPLGVLMIINKIGSLRFKSNDEEMLKKMCPYITAALVHNYYREHNHIRKMEIDYFRDLSRREMMPCRHQEKLNQDQEDRVAEIFPQMIDPVWYIKSTDEDIRDRLMLNMILDVIDEPGMNVTGLQKMVRWAHNGYRNIQYHNFAHAFNVAHCIYSLIKRNPNKFKPIEKKGLIIAALFHDIDHPGFNNNYFHLTRQPLAKLYPESTLECHHYSVANSFLKVNQIFDNMNKVTYSEVLTEIHVAIMATDLAQYFQNRSDLCRVLQANKFQWDNVSHRTLVKGVIMTLADLSGLLKDFEVVHTLTNRLYSEFYNQGDIETALGFPPVSMMDRKKRHIVPKDQYHFMNIIVIPCVELLTKLIPNVQVSLNKGIEIRTKWFEILQKGQKYWDRMDNFEEEENQFLESSLMLNDA